jgi:hypothetical protein
MRLRSLMLESLAKALLEPGEREAVLGDLLEMNTNTFRAVRELCGLFARRQLALWTDWRPWLAGPALALPSSFLLMGLSLGVSQQVIQAASSGISRSLHWSLLSQIALLIGFSFSAGFAVSWLSRRTLWVSAALCFSANLFCLSRFPAGNISRFSLIVFLLPGVIGILTGLNVSTVPLLPAMTTAVGLTVLTIVTRLTSGPAWWELVGLMFYFTMLWPGWFVAAMAYQLQGRRFIR